MRTPTPGARPALVSSLAILIAGFAAGIATYLAAVDLRANGLDLGSAALLLLAPMCLLVGEVVAVRLRAWLGAVLLPFAVAAGMVVLGPV